MADTSHAHTIDVEHDDHSHGGTGKYIVVFLALCVLTGASFFTYSQYWPFRDTPSIGRTFMLAVSSVKALLVILFFMHLLWEANWKYVLTIPAALMSLFLVCMLIPDVGRRTVRYSEERWTYAAEPIEDNADHDSSGEGHSTGQPSDEQHGESTERH